MCDCSAYGRHEADADRRQDGFTVIELMVALVILALGVAALTGALSDSVFRATHAEKEAAAVRMAETWLARLGTDRPVVPGVTSGQTDGILWMQEIAPYGTDAELAVWRVRPASVTLTLEWPESGHRHLATWHTLRVMAAPAAAP